MILSHVRSRIDTARGISDEERNMMDFEFKTDEWYLDSMGRPWKVNSPKRRISDGLDVMVVSPWTPNMYHCNAFEIAVADTDTTATVMTDNGFTTIYADRPVKGNEVLDWVRRQTNGRSGNTCIRSGGRKRYGA